MKTTKKLHYVFNKITVFDMRKFWKFQENVLTFARNIYINNEKFDLKILKRKCLRVFIAVTLQPILLLSSSCKNSFEFDKRYDRLYGLLISSHACTVSLKNVYSRLNGNQNYVIILKLHNSVVFSTEVH